MAFYFLFMGVRWGDAFMDMGLRQGRAIDIGVDK